MNYSEELPLSILDARTDSDRLVELWRIWRTTSGRESDDLLAISPWLLITGVPYENTGTPPFLFAGLESLATKVVGSEWAAIPPQGQRWPDRDHEPMCAAGYHKAMCGEPSYSHISMSVTKQTPAVHVVYERLIAPFTLGGLKALVVLSSPVQVHPLNSLSDQQDPDGYSIPDGGLGLGAMAERSTVASFHSHA